MRPDRGRRFRKSDESHHNSTAPYPIQSISHPDTHLPFFPDRVVPQQSTPTVPARCVREPSRLPTSRTETTDWNRSASGAPRAESPHTTPQPHPPLSSVERTTKNLPSNAPPQFSYPVHGHNHSTQIQNSDPILNSITTQPVQAENWEDIFGYPGNDSEIRERQGGHLQPSKAGNQAQDSQAGNKDESHKVPQKRAPTANMQLASSESFVTPMKLRPKQDKTAPWSKSPSAHIEDRRSPSESRESRWNDVGGDEEDDEYTPQTRSKRHKANSSIHTDKSVVVKSRPMRRPVRDSEERPVVRSGDHRGVRLPTPSKAKRKPPAKASSLGQKKTATAAPGAIGESDDLFDEAFGYIGTLELPGACPTDRAGDHARKSPLPCTSEAPNTPKLKTEQNVAPRNSASRKATLEKVAALQTAAKDRESLASSTKPTVPVGGHNHAPTGPNSTPVTNGQHIAPSRDTSDTISEPEPSPPQHVQELGRVARHISGDVSLTKERHLTLAGRNVPEQANPLQRLSSGVSFANEQREIPPVSCQPKQTSPTPHRPATQPHIIYYVFAKPNGRPTLLQWPDGSLIGRTIETLFDEVASLACTRDIKSISFKLTASQKDAVCVVQRNDVGSFDIMKRKFASLINEDLKSGNSDFEIELDPDHGAPQGQMRIRDDDADPGLSFG